jgi:hypothetical protein
MNFCLCIKSPFKRTTSNVRLDDGANSFIGLIGTNTRSRQRKETKAAVYLLLLT